MHAATVDRSNRLKRLWAVLRDRKSHSTRDLMRKARVCAVSACISEIRAAGKHITCKRRGDRWFYQLTTGKG